MKTQRSPIRRRGIATVEFALIAPLMLLMLAGVLDFAMALRTASCVTAAARIGAEFGSQSAYASANYAGMQNAAVNSAPGLAGITASAVQSCQCPGGLAVSCSGVCSGGNMLVYVQVTVSAPVHTIFNYSALNVPASVKATASMRAQ